VPRVMLPSASGRRKAGTPGRHRPIPPMTPLSARPWMGRSTAWNRGAEKIFGYPGIGGRGKTDADAFPPDRVNEEVDILARIRRARAWNISKPSGCERMARESTFP